MTHADPGAAPETRGWWLEVTLPVDGDGMIDDADLPCGECGYLIHKLNVTRNCPECGKPAIDTLHDAFEPDPADRWLERVERGVRAVRGSLIVYLFCPPIGMLMMMFGTFGLVKRHVLLGDALGLSRWVCLLSVALIWLPGFLIEGGLRAVLHALIAVMLFQLGSVCWYAIRLADRWDEPVVADGIKRAWAMLSILLVMCVLLMQVYVPWDSIRMLEDFFSYNSPPMQPVIVTACLWLIASLYGMVQFGRLAARCEMLRGLVKPVAFVTRQGQAMPPA